MPWADVVSFKCRDEQEFGSDEVYVSGSSSTGWSEQSPIYGGLDTNDTIHPRFDALEFGRNGFVNFVLWEDDGAAGDDMIGSVIVDYTPEHRGTHTVTLSSSGAEYDLTYRVW